MQTILVCDDDKQIVEAIDIYLTGEGFKVIKAYDGYEALEYLDKNEVDLLIVDVMMPGLDGIRTTLKVRETAVYPSSSSPPSPRMQIRFWDLTLGQTITLQSPLTPWSWWPGSSHRCAVIPSWGT